MRVLLTILALSVMAPAARATTIEGISQAGKSVSVNVTTMSNVASLNVAIATVTPGVTVPVSLGTSTVSVIISTPLAVYLSSSAAVSVSSVSCPNVSVSTGQVLSASQEILPADAAGSRCGCLLSNDSDTKGFLGVLTVSASPAVLGVGQAVRAGQSLSIDAAPGVFTGSLFAISNTTATYSALCTYR